ncbi:MAG: gliding motility-associated C-terminal domain-containing protein [Bacteroidales bacterium]|nr:gliding motility-associated C-terminal domain-containing protein [Bacteroidales bacterium]
MFAPQGFSQFKQIGGIVNIYTTIDTIYSFNVNNVDSLVVGSVIGFNVGDTVMIYCVQGAEIATDTIIWEDNVGRDTGEPRNTGKYAFLIINEIIGAPRNLVVLNATVRPEIEPMGDGEVTQLIRVPSYRWAEVTPTGLTAKAWDGSTGGVVAIFVQQTLRLNGPIDASYKGFTGARGSEDSFYGGDCSSVNQGLYDSAFYHISNIRAGLKGGGTTDTRFDYMRGKASNINGGGGGNALFSGGGGGSNLSAGGKGGDESSQCAPGVEAPGGRGGFDLGRPGDAYYLNKDEDVTLYRYDRIFLGGGGGAGTRVSGRSTTNGGDGGGLVIIVADTIEGNDNEIRANGYSVMNIATGAGGGGGGGGCIILDVSGYKTNLNLSAVGGKGGDTNHPIDTTGPGGGGGGGIYWMAGSSNPLVNTLTSTNAASGEHLTFAIKYGAGDGGYPGEKYGLEAPLRGFLFNSVPSEFTVCSDLVPDPIYASKPKGGDGTYEYQWVDSTSTHTWQQAPGSDYDKQNYTFPGTLSDTTWFRRIVRSGLLPADTSFRIAFYVHQAITDNTVLAPDTVCSGNAPMLFAPSATIGGGLGSGTHTFKWQKDEDTGSYTDADGPGPIDQATYQAPGLTTTTHFARIAYSGVCVDTSAALTVKVWEQLTGNDITPFDTICYNTAPDLINGPVPGEGDQSDISYKWETSSDIGGPWSAIGGADSISYQPSALTQTSYFRRVVLSGSDDACIDLSEPVEILNIPLITSNSISQTQTVCTGDQPDLLQGSDPGGGYLGQYSYRWQSRTQSTSWVPADGINDIKTGYDPGIMDGDTTFFRRVVGSGGTARNVCLDTSNQQTIHVLPSITNNLITSVNDEKCQWDLLDDITQNVTGGATPGGGATDEGGNDPTRIYQWEVTTGQVEPGAWQVISGAESINYEDNPQLDTDENRWYRRIVFSGPAGVCKDTAIQTIAVHTQITDYNIVESDSVCFADTKVLLGFTSSGEAGEVPEYTWRNLNSGLDIPDSDQEDFDYDHQYNSLDSVRYERVVNIGACTDTSNIMQITVMQLPGGMLTDNAFRACERNAELAIDLTIEDLETIVSPWEVYLKNGVDTQIGPYIISGDGNLDVSLETEVDSTQFNYEIESITYYSTEGRFSCVAPAGNISGVVPVKVFRKPEPVITPADSSKVCDNQMNLSADSDNGEGQWSQVNTDLPLLTFSDPIAENTAVFIQDISERYGKYRIKYRSVAGDCFGEDFLDVHFFEQPADAYAGEDTMIFLKNSVQLKADPPTAGIGTWELISGSGIIEDEHAHNTFAYELGLGEENKFRWTVVNGEDEGICSPSDDVVIVILNEVKRYEGFSPNRDMNNEYYIMQGLKYADTFTLTFFNSLGNTVRTITEKNIDEMEINESLISGGLREDEMVVWDGRSNNGNEVPSGTYYFVVEFIMNQRHPVTDAITRTDSYDFKDYVVVIRE